MNFDWGKLRRSISMRQGYAPYILINGRPRRAETLDVALQIIEDLPIPGPLSMWLVVDSKVVCIGEIGAWKSTPIAYGRWEELFPVFEVYVRML